MMRRSFRIGLRLGLLGGVAAAVAKAVQSRRSSSPTTEEPPAWPPIQPEQVGPAVPEAPDVQAEVDTPPPVKKKATTKKAPATKKAAKKAAAPAWVEPVGSVCPPSHPVKAKLASRLYHLPGMFAYARAVPDRCYAAPEQAEADGLTRAKR
jgi:hypothetical protein